MNPELHWCCIVQLGDAGYFRIELIKKNNMKNQQSWICGSVITPNSDLGETVGDHSLSRRWSGLGRSFHCDHANGPVVIRATLKSGSNLRTLALSICPKTLYLLIQAHLIWGCVYWVLQSQTFIHVSIVVVVIRYQRYTDIVYEVLVLYWEWSLLSKTCDYWGNQSMLVNCQLTMELLRAA